jgi:hypothetical protein
VFHSPTPGSIGRFGSSVALVGPTLVVGAHNEGHNYSGSVHLFDRFEGDWKRTLVNPSPSSGELFGFSVAALGENVLVGDLSADTSVADAGAVYVFNSEGDLLRTIQSPRATRSEGFGFSIAATATVAQKIAIIGAPGVAFPGTTNQPGTVYAIDLETGAPFHSWTSPEPSDEDLFGRSIAVDSQRVLIGAPYADVGAENAGAAYLFDLATGRLLQTIHNPTPLEHERFGFAVALRGDDALIGAPYELNQWFQSGAAYLIQVVPEPGSDILAGIVAMLTVARWLRRRPQHRAGQTANLDQLPD